MSARTERVFPFCVAAIVAALAAIAVFTGAFGPVSQALPAGTMTFGIVVAGFAATQRNMLLGMRGSTVLRVALRTGYHHDILAYLMHCVYAGISVSAVSAVGFFVGGNALTWNIWAVLLAFTVGLVLALIVSNELLMARVVKRFLEDPGNRSG